MALIDKTNSTKVVESFKIASNIDKVNGVISNIINSVSSEIILSDISPNGDNSKIILINDTLVVTVNALTAYNIKQKTVIEAAKIVYDIDNQFDILAHVTKKIFDLDILNLQGATALKTSKGLPVRGQRTQAVQKVYTLRDAVTFITIIGKLAPTDAKLKNLVSTLLENMSGKKSEIITGVYASIDFELQNKIFAYNSVFNDTTNGTFAPALILGVTMKDKLGNVTVATATKVASGDGSFGVAVDNVTNVYTSLDSILYIEYTFNIETTYTFSTLFAFDSFLSSKFAQLPIYTILNTVLVNDTGFVA